MLCSVPQPQLGSSAKPPPWGSRQSKAAGHTPQHPSWWLEAGEFLQRGEKRPSTPRVLGQESACQETKARSKLVQPVAAYAEGQLGTGGV